MDPAAEAVGDTALDAIAMCYEHDADPHIIAVSVTIVTLNDRGPSTVISAWASGHD